MKLYKILMVSVLLYRSESWIFTKNHRPRMQAIEMRFLQKKEKVLEEMVLETRISEMSYL